MQASPESRSLLCQLCARKHDETLRESAQYGPQRSGQVASVKELQSQLLAGEEPQQPPVLKVCNPGGTGRFLIKTLKILHLAFICVWWGGDPASVHATKYRLKYWENVPILRTCSLFCLYPLHNPM